MKLKGSKILTFILATIIYVIMTIITLIAAGSNDEGTGGSGLIIITLSRLYQIFRFPTHTLFFEYFNGSNFFIGLIINCLLYGFITERLITTFIDKGIKK